MKQEEKFVRPRLEAIIDDWRSTFGLCEFEMLAKSIVEFLRSDTPSKHHLLGFAGYEQGEGWAKRFVIEDVTTNPSVFAAMGMARGYFEHQWFPKWCFVVTDEFIRRCPTETYEARFAAKGIALMD